MPKPLFFLSLLLLLSVYAQGQSELEPIQFQIKNAGITVDGSMSDWEIEIAWNAENPSASIFSGKARPSSIDTGIKLRDKHLLGRQYFHVDKYPEIDMQSMRISEAKEKGEFHGVFRITIRDVQKEIPVQITVKEAGGSRSFTAVFAIDRLDFGLGEKSLVLADEVNVRISAKVK